MTDSPVVVLAMPRRGNMVAFGASEGFHLLPSIGKCTVLRTYTASSLLDHTFNRLWCAALNIRKTAPVTHFAMIHDDVCPQQGWLDLLVEELAASKADILSAVVPIKGPEGLTSTAVETDDVWRPRRLTLHECHKLPITFGDEHASGELLLNSGLWVCDIRKPWVDQPTPLVFQTLNRITQDDAGDWQAQVRSEDWEFSRAARARGAVLKATRIVSLVHAGEQDYPNDRPWGQWETDQFFKPQE